MSAGSRCSGSAPLLNVNTWPVGGATSAEVAARRSRAPARAAAMARRPAGEARAQVRTRSGPRGSLRAIFVGRVHAAQYSIPASCRVPSDACSSSPPGASRTARPSASSSTACRPDFRSTSALDPARARPPPPGPVLDHDAAQARRTRSRSSPACSRARTTGTPDRDARPEPGRQEQGLRRAQGRLPPRPRRLHLRRRSTACATTAARAAPPGRETLGRVAAGAIAKRAARHRRRLDRRRHRRRRRRRRRRAATGTSPRSNPIRCPDAEAARRMIERHRGRARGPGLGRRRGRGRRPRLPGRLGRSRPWRSSTARSRAR